MSVGCTPDGRFYVAYPKGYNKIDPGRTREYFGRGPESEAAAHTRNIELGLGKPKVDHTPILDKLFNEYLDAKSPSMSKDSLIALTKKFSSIVLPELGHLKGSQITPKVLDGFVKKRLETVKSTTVHRDISDIRAVIRWSVKRKYIASNPMEGFEMPTRDDEIIQPPTPNEVRAILDNATPQLFRAIIISYYSGLRPGAVELYSLTWQDINLIDKTILVRSAKKGGLRWRSIPIVDDMFLQLLNEWIEQDLNGYITKRGKVRKKKLSDPVITRNNKPVKSLKVSWKMAKEKAKITRRLRMYDLRHAFATLLLDNGADLKHVSTLLGHKSIQQTVDTYQHTSKKLSEETVQKLPSILKK